MENIKKRFKNPLFIFALASLIYQLLKLFNLEIDEGTFREIVDLVSYLFLGFGIYQSFEKEPKEEEKGE